MQDTVTYAHPCKRYAGKRFLLTTWEEIYKTYLQEPQFHQHGVLSKTTMRVYKPKYILLSGCTPLNQCLCDYCENCELLRRALVAVDIKGIPSNKYTVVDATFCDMWQGQFGTTYEFSRCNCITRECSDCKWTKLSERINQMNQQVLKTNKTLTWHQWQLVQGCSAPQKCAVKGTLWAAVNEFLDIVDEISQYLFRANWHRNIFQYIKNHLEIGTVLQVMDFAMNFNKRYQDEVQSAYWSGTQMTIHGTINFYKCLTQGCEEVVTLSLEHITDDLKHNSFLVHAAQNLTFKYLVEIGVPLHLIVQFCDNCAAQYKSRHLFAELARSSLEIIRVYFGEKHGKSHADALFGRLKAWMAYKIKARHFIVTDAYEFFKYCREYYQTPKLDICQHYRVEFQFIHPSDVRRHHDCDLDQHVPNTHHLYSVRNTPEPLKLKVRSVPYLCPPCIHDDGSECLNADYTDAWKTVDLIPTKGSNKRKYQKRKRTDAEIRPTKQTLESVPVVINDEDSSDDELPEISFDAEPFKKWKEKKQIAENETNLQERVTDTVTDTVTDSVTDQETENIESNAQENGKSCEKTCTWKNVEEPITAADFVTSSESTSDSINDIEVIGICEQGSKEFQMCAENALSVSHENISVCELIRNDVPDSIYWYSILTSLESCNTFEQLQKLANELKEQIPPLPPHMRSTYNPEEDDIDFVAQAEIPIDGPRLL